MKYPQYIVDMFMELQDAENADNYDPNLCDRMMAVLDIECEEYAGGITDWYTELVMQCIEDDT